MEACVELYVECSGGWGPSRRRRARVGRRLVIVCGYHVSDGTMSATPERHSSRIFAEGHRIIRIFTYEKAFELEVFAVDVVNASSDGKRTGFANAVELDTYLGDKLSRCEVVLEEPADDKQVWGFVTRSC